MQCQGESGWCLDVTSPHGVQRCTGVQFFLSGGLEKHVSSFANLVHGPGARTEANTCRIIGACLVDLMRARGLCVSLPERLRQWT